MKKDDLNELAVAKGLLFMWYNLYAKRRDQDKEEEEKILSGLEVRDANKILSKDTEDTESWPAKEINPGAFFFLGKEGRAEMIKKHMKTNLDNYGFAIQAFGFSKNEKAAEILGEELLAANNHWAEIIMKAMQENASPILIKWIVEFLRKSHSDYITGVAVGVIQKVRHE